MLVSITYCYLLTFFRTVYYFTMLSCKLKSARRSVTLVCDKLSVELSKLPPSINVIAGIKGEIEDLKIKLSALNASREEELEQLIDENPDDASVCVELDKFEEYDRKLASALSSANYCLSRQSNQQSCSGERNVPSVKLPKLNLPFFAGNILEWQEFQESFLAAVYNSSLP